MRPPNPLQRFRAIAPRPLIAPTGIMPRESGPAQAAPEQETPRRQGVLPGRAPTLAVAPSADPAPTLAVTPMEPEMSLLGRIGGAVKGAVTGFVTGGPTGAVIGGARGLTTRASTQVPGRGASSFPGTLVPQERGCPQGTFRGPMGSCIDVLPGGATSGGGLVLTSGEVVQGRYGAAVMPRRTSMEVRRCPPGLKLAKDGMCYPNVPRTHRMWDPGRKPLLTGGDLNAIARAARVAERMKVQQRKLEALGLLKKPKPRAAPSSRGVITKAEASRALRA